MTRGRKKLSNVDKKLRGTDQPCRMTPAVPQTQTVAVLPKSSLKGTAKKIYTIVGTELACKGLLDGVNTDLLLAYCREMAMYQDCMKEVDKEGVTIDVETKNGFVTVINPKRKAAESALANAKALAAEFGLSPASRARVAAMLAGGGKKDDFADFESTIDEQ